MQQVTELDLPSLYESAFSSSPWFFSKKYCKLLGLYIKKTTPISTITSMSIKLYQTYIYLFSISHWIWPHNLRDWCKHSSVIIKRLWKHQIEYCGKYDNGTRKKKKDLHSSNNLKKHIHISRCFGMILVLENA